MQKKCKSNINISMTSINGNISNTYNFKAKKKHYGGVVNVLNKYIKTKNDIIYCTNNS